MISSASVMLKHSLVHFTQHLSGMLTYSFKISSLQYSNNALLKLGSQVMKVRARFRPVLDLKSLNTLHGWLTVGQFLDFDRSRSN